MGLNGESGNGHSTAGFISADGRYVCFRSYATDLITQNTSGFAEIYVRDTVLQTTERVSTDYLNIGCDASCYEPVLSADGQVIAFRSFATNIVADDTNNSYDIFVHDRRTGITERISTRTNGYEGNGASSAPTISANGRFVAFHSVASNLVSNDTNNQVDVFLRDLERDATVRISLTNGGKQANHRSQEPSISACGRWVAFYSYASNLVDGDTNNHSDIFVRDNLLQTTERVSLSTAGLQASADCIKPAISADGRWVSFQSTAANLVGGDTNGVSDVFIHDRHSGLTERVNVDSANIEGDNASVNSHLSADGRFVVFQSAAGNLIATDTNGSDDVFIRDRLTGTTERLNIDRYGNESDGLAFEPSISADGSRVAFWATAGDLALNDANGNDDIFVRDRNTAPTKNIMVLTGPWRRRPGQKISLDWYAGPPSSFYALAASLSRSGSTFASHSFELGEPFQVLTFGEHLLDGRGTFVSAPISANLSGRNLYFEVAALGLGGVTMDSIVHTVVVL